jgi:hypothetical protein
VAFRLQRSPAEGNSLSARVAFIIAPLLLVGLAATAEVKENESVRSTLHSDTPRSPATAPGAIASLPARTEETDTIDLYGNEVSDAVAKYKLDATGAVYETHSPQTEVPRLGAPKG